MKIPYRSKHQLIVKLVPALLELPPQLVLSPTEESPLAQQLPTAFITVGKCLENLLTYSASWGF